MSLFVRSTQTDFIGFESYQLEKVASSASRVSSVLDMRTIYVEFRVVARFILRFFCVPHGRIWVHGVWVGLGEIEEGTGKGDHVLWVRGEG